MNHSTDLDTKLALHSYTRELLNMDYLLRKTGPRAVVQLSLLLYPETGNAKWSPAELRRHAKMSDFSRCYSVGTTTMDQLKRQLKDITRHAQQAYERRYGMTTAEMRAKASVGELGESPDIKDWLMLDNRRRALL